MTTSTLAARAAAVVSKSFTSPEARFLLEADPNNIMEAQEAQLASVEARGRFMGHDQKGKVRYSRTLRIDGARFAEFDPETKKITLRVDSTELVDFWMEVTFSVSQLEEWLGLYQ